MKPEEKKSDTEDKTLIGSISAVFSKFDNEPKTEFLQEPDLPKETAGPPTAAVVLLKLLPFLLIAGVIVSIWWDFPAQQITFPFDYTVEFSGLLRILSVSGLIGFGTNWLAIRMLFYPRKKRPLLGHGLIPARKAMIAERMAVAVEKNLINPERIREHLIKTGQLQQISEMIISYLRDITSDETFRNDFKNLLTGFVKKSLDDSEIRAKIIGKTEELILRKTDDSRLDKIALRMFILLKGKELKYILEDELNNVPEAFSEAYNEIGFVLDKLPEKLQNEQEEIEKIILRVAEKSLRRIHVQKIVHENLDQYDEAKLESLIKGATAEHLQFIQYLGAIIGTLAGFLIWDPVISLIFFLSVGLLVWLMDVGISRYAD